MIIENTLSVSFPDFLPKDRKEYYLKIINDFHSLINLSISNEEAIIALSSAFDECEE